MINLDDYKLVAKIGPCDNRKATFEYTVVQDMRSAYHCQLIKPDFTDLRMFLSSIGVNLPFEIYTKKRGIQKPVLRIITDTSTEQEIFEIHKDTINEKFSALVR